MKAKENLILIALYMPPALKKALEKVAKKEDRSVSAMVRYLVKQYIDSKSE